MSGMQEVSTRSAAQADADVERIVAANLGRAPRVLAKAAGASSHH